MKPSVQIGDVVAARYRVERVLGVGGMGTVVAARDVTTDALCAVKVMNPEPSGSATWVERFRREAMVGASLRSEHAVRVLDVGGLDEGRPYLVMEHLDGADLGKVLRKRGPLPFGEAALFVSQACAAVAEAHALGIVHRDLKPANLFFTRRADGSVCVKVLDFGISKLALAGDDDDAPHMTRTGDVLGSPAYMAPEQIRAFSKVDPRSDVWALGVILYELCTGRWPFPGKASIELIAMVLERAPEPPRAHRPGLPPDFEAVVMRCLQKDPAQRMPSALALQEALAPYLPRPASDDEVTVVVPPRFVPAASPSAAPPGAVTTADPMVAGPHTTGSIAAARAQAGPSTRAVFAVAAAALTVIVVTLTALLRSPGTAAEGDRPEGTATANTGAATANTGAATANTGAATANTGAATANTGAATANTGAATVDPSARPSADPAPPPAATVATGDTAALPDAAAPVGPSAPEGTALPESASRPSGRAVTPGFGKTAPEPTTPRSGGRELDPVAARAALGSAALAAKRCKRPGGPTGGGRVDVTFATSGNVVSARVSAPFEGTATGACILSAFRAASVPSFEGSSFVASKAITIK